MHDCMGGMSKGACGGTVFPTSKRDFCSNVNRLKQKVSNCDFVIQLTPAQTDFKGSTISICYRRISVIANIEI